MLTLMFRPILLFVLLMLGACQPIEQAPPALNARDHSLDAAKQPAVGEGKIEKDSGDVEGDGTDAPPAGAVVPRARVEFVEPGQEALAQAILSASKSSLDECRANSGGGTLRVRIVSTKTAAKITLDSDSKMSDKVRNCVIGALSTIDVPDTLSNAAPSMRPSAGFTSTFAINW